MIEANKTYGFTIAVKELRETVPNIWRYASAYKRMNNLTSKGLWEMFVEPKPEPERNEPPQDPETPPLPEEILRSEPGRNGLPEIDPEAMEGESYNMCHFWSNFEIARLSFFRSKEYEDFFEMMDRSGGFWMERVSGPGQAQTSALAPTHPPLPVPGRRANLSRSGVMHLSTRSPPVPCCPLATSITSVTLATDTRPSSTALPTRRSGGSCLGNRSSRRQHWTSGSASRRTTTGSTGTRQRRTAWAAGAAATPTLSTSKARRAAVWPSGSTSPAGGPALRRGEAARKGPEQPGVAGCQRKGSMYTQNNPHRAWMAWSRRERTRTQTRDRSCHD